MIRYSSVIILHIAAICGLAVLAFVCLCNSLWFSAIFAGAVLIAFAARLYRLQMRQIRMIRQLARSLNSDDMMISFSSPYRNREFEEMVGELSGALNRFRSRLIERNEVESWQKLIRVMNHEIMNSITPILSLSETLSEREADEKNYAVMQQAMQTIHRRSRGLLAFVENYRKLTRIPAPVLEPVSSKELFGNLRQLFPEDFIDIKEPKRDDILSVDKAQIEQVMINLIKNAVEACEGMVQPKIEIEIRRSENDGHTIEVRDNGCGIVPSAIDEVFVPFYTTKPNGSGIGLSLCRQIISNHGGKISAESSSASGTIFKVVLPTGKCA